MKWDSDLPSRSFAKSLLWIHLPFRLRVQDIVSMRLRLVGQGMRSIVASGTTDQLDHSRPENPRELVLVLAQVRNQINHSICLAHSH